MNEYPFNACATVEAMRARYERAAAVLAPKPPAPVAVPDVEIFDPARHLAMVDGWWTEWRGRVLPADWYPRVGFIVPGIIAQWVYLTDSKVAYLEPTLSARFVAADARELGLRAVMTASEEYARQCGAKYLVAHTANDKLAERAHGDGFNVSPVPMRKLVKGL